MYKDTCGPPSVPFHQFPQRCLDKDAVFLQNMFVLRINLSKMNMDSMVCLVMLVPSLSHFHPTVYMFHLMSAICLF